MTLSFVRSLDEKLKLGTRYATRAWKFRCFYRIAGATVRSRKGGDARRERRSKNPSRYKSIRGAKRQRAARPIGWRTRRRLSATSSRSGSEDTRSCERARQGGSDIAVVREWGERGGYGRTRWAALAGTRGSATGFALGFAHTRCCTCASGAVEWGGRPCAAPRALRLRDLSRTLVNYELNTRIASNMDDTATGRADKTVETLASTREREQYRSSYKMMRCTLNVGSTFLKCVI